VKAEYLVIYRDAPHWWQRFWYRITRSQVLWAGYVTDEIDLNKDSVRFVWDARGLPRIVVDQDDR